MKANSPKSGQSWTSDKQTECFVGGSMYPKMRLVMVSSMAVGLATLVALAAAQEPQLPHYVSGPVPAPAADAPYMLPDKTVYVLANDLVGPYFEALDDLFTKTHPNIRIHLN